MNIFEKYIEMITSANVAMPTPDPGQAALQGTIKPKKCNKKKKKPWIGLQSRPVQL